MPFTHSLKKPKVSILILTLNEENNIKDCLKSVAWSDDVVVLDSLSKDKTIKIARSMGARIATRKFDDWSSHQNWALNKIKFKHRWVFYIDADERVTDELRDELIQIASDDRRKEVAYFCGRRNIMWGKWIKHAFPPGYIFRFFKPGYIHFERLVHPIPSIKGPHGYLKKYLDHYHFSKGLEEWFEKHNRYSTFEAIEGFELLSKPFNWVELFTLDPYERRQALKKLSIRLPFRAPLKFFYLFLGKMGFLDGYSGFIYCVLQSIYEYMIVVKTREIKLKKLGIDA
jgi:glycosyltransferase involved in cell wall biosynthesis